MKPLSLKDLAKIIEAPDTKITARTITGVSTDSRTTKAGECFFAIAGENFDGHNYLRQAFENGALCAVVSKDLPGDSLLKVTDTVKALGKLARWYRNACDFKVVAITGSVGKTTTRQIACHVLSRHYRLCQAPKNFNNDIGLPLTILSADPQDQIIVAELGSNYPGEIEYLAKIAQPDIAVVTNIHLAHLEGLGDLETIKAEKLSIARGLKPNGIFITNPASQITPSNIVFQGPSSRFRLEDTDITLPLPGRGNLENALTAWSICRRFDITIADFAAAVKTFHPVPMRCELLQTAALTILNDCYNANPASMKNALETLVSLSAQKTGRRVFICGDMAELGSQTEQLHLELAADIIKAEVHLMLAVGKSAKIAANTAKNAAEYDLHTKCFEDTFSACNNLHKFIKVHDIILVKGSRASKLELAVEKLKELSAPDLR
jgi:UDP-N-acetylmuramoyl-tripeptide--D-alanyl-D-alanine ligase